MQRRPSEHPKLSKERLVKLFNLKKNKLSTTCYCGENHSKEQNIGMMILWKENRRRKWIEGLRETEKNRNRRHTLAWDASLERLFVVLKMISARGKWSSERRIIISIVRHMPASTASGGLLGWVHSWHCFPCVSQRAASQHIQDER